MAHRSLLAVVALALAASAAAAVETPLPAGGATMQAGIDTQARPKPAFRTSRGTRCQGDTGRCTWQLTLGGVLEDKACAVAPAPDRGVFVAGHSRSFGDPHYDGWVVRLDRRGDVVWQRVLGGRRSDHLYGVVATGDGGALVAGHTGADGGGRADGWVARLDDAGGVLWQRRFGGDGDDRFRAAAAMPGGGYVVVGFTRGRSGDDDAWVLRLDGDGERLWARTFGGDADDGAGAITVAGYTRTGGTGGYDAWLFRLAGDGTLAWQRRFDHGTFDAASSVTAAADGGVLVLGMTSPAGLSREHTWAARLDDRGAVQWRRRFAGAGRDTGWRALTMPDGGFVIALATSSRGAGSTDTWLLRLDGDGRL